MTMTERLKDRPKYGEYVIPYTVVVINGVPDFRVTDMERWEECVVGKLCAICGGPLDYWVWYIGGKNCADSGLYFDLAMHEECCFYAASVCPFLAAGRDYSSRPQPDGASQNMIMVQHNNVVKASVLYASKRRRDQLRVFDNGDGQMLACTGPEIQRIQIWPKESKAGE